MTNTKESNRQTPGGEALSFCICRRRSSPDSTSTPRAWVAAARWRSGGGFVADGAATRIVTCGGARVEAEDADDGGS